MQPALWLVVAATDRSVCACCTARLNVYVSCRQPCLCAAALMKSAGSSLRLGQPVNPSRLRTYHGPARLLAQPPLRASRSSSSKCFSWTPNSFRRLCWQVGAVEVVLHCAAIVRWWARGQALHAALAQPCRRLKPLVCWRQPSAVSAHHQLCL